MSNLLHDAQQTRDGQLVENAQKICANAQEICAIYHRRNEEEYTELSSDSYFYLSLRPTLNSTSERSAGVYCSRREFCLSLKKQTSVTSANNKSVKENNILRVILLGV